MLIAARLAYRAWQLAKMTMRQQGLRRLPAPTLLLAAVGLVSITAFSYLHPSYLHAQDDPDRQQTASQTPANPAIPETLPKGKKLILADGSFQMVREYQREGDRVRYYSVERSAWEEIPASLVNWESTQKAEAEQATQDKELAQKIEASELAARTAEIDSDRSLEVRPGVILPDEAGLYLLDGQRVSTLEQALAVSHLDKGHEIARIVTGVPLISSKHHIELPGSRAKLRIHGNDPEFYFRPVDGRDAHLSLLRLDVDGGKRNVESMSTNIADISSYKNHQVPLLAWDAARGVKRFTVEEKLEPGEYAIAENRTDGEVDLYLWDFGLDASPTGTKPAR
jgi:hypothetical protein